MPRSTASVVFGTAVATTAIHLLLQPELRASLCSRAQRWLRRARHAFRDWRIAPSLSASASLWQLTKLMDAYLALDPADAAPVEWLERFAAAAGALELDTDAFAAAMDAVDPLRGCRDAFAIPLHTDGSQQVYLTGHSLGLMPAATPAAVDAELRKWGASGVEGHFTGALPWAECEQTLPELLAEVVGAKEARLEVAAMNSLTVNLHMLMAAFYRPRAGRAAILIEAGAFPSDRYAVRSQLSHHGYDPGEWLIEVQPGPDGLLHRQDIFDAIDVNRPRLALVLLGGVNYLTGQVLDMPAIAEHVASTNRSAAARGEPPVLLGFDIAHAVGNVPLQLHEWGVDFAAWCSYKYLNSGAGCLAGIFVHERHATDTERHPRLTGWWGVPFNPGPRFQMRHGFDAAPGAAGFACSNVNPLLVACVKASLELLRDAGGVAATRRKSLLLTGYLELLLLLRGLHQPRNGDAAVPPRCGVTVTSPLQPERRGCQLSLRVEPPKRDSAQSAGAPRVSMRELESILQQGGVVTDAREPDIVRAAPVPLYNSFRDVLEFVTRLEVCLEKLAQ